MIYSGLQYKHAYSVCDAAKTLGIGKTKLYELIKNSELRTVKLGRRTLIRAEELKRFIDSLEEMEVGNASR